MADAKKVEKESSSPYLSHIVGDTLRDLTEKRLAELVRTEPVPKHLAIIMDGNRRFAGERGLDVQDGHQAAGTLSRNSSTGASTSKSGS